MDALFMGRDDLFEEPATSSLGPTVFGELPEGGTARRSGSPSVVGRAFSLDGTLS